MPPNQTNAPGDKKKGRLGPPHKRRASTHPAGSALTRNRLAWPSLEVISISLLLLAMVSFYFWTVSTNGKEPNTPSNYYYPLLARSFVDGHLCLEIEPAPELLALPDPYDPAQNKHYRLHDASLYKGKYYIYFGATPAALLFAPYFFFTLQSFPQPMAVALFCSLGYLFGAWLFLLIVRDYYPNISLGLKLACLLTLGLADVCPFLLRRPDVYEAAISCAYCLMQLAFLNFYLALRHPQPLLSRLLVVSLCLGAAVGSRPNFVLAVPVFAFFLIWLCRERVIRNRASPWSPLLALIPVSMVGLLIAAYNYFRFDNPLEFGTSYVLAGVNMHEAHSIEMGNLPYNLWFYLFCPPHLISKFPFIYADPLIWFKLPSYRLNIEEVSGLFLISPISLLVLALPFLMRKANRTLGMTLLFMALATLAASLTLLFFSGSTMRYLCDFAPACIFLSCIAACHISISLPRERRAERLLFHAFLMILFSISCLSGLFLSFSGYYNYLQVGSPQTYATLAWFFHPIETIANLF